MKKSKKARMFVHNLEKKEFSLIINIAFFSVFLAQGQIRKESQEFQRFQYFLLIQSIYCNRFHTGTRIQNEQLIGN